MTMAPETLCCSQKNDVNLQYVACLESDIEKINNENSAKAVISTNQNKPNRQNK